MTLSGIILRSECVSVLAACGVFAPALFILLIPSAVCHENDAPGRSAERRNFGYPSLLLFEKPMSGYAVLSDFPYVFYI